MAEHVKRLCRVPDLFKAVIIELPVKCNVLAAYEVLWQDLSRKPRVVDYKYLRPILAPSKYLLVFKVIDHVPELTDELRLGVFGPASRLLDLFGPRFVFFRHRSYPFTKCIF